MSITPPFPPDQLWELESILQRATCSHEQDTIGTHWELISFLQNLGYAVNSREGAINLARKIINEVTY